MTEPERTSFVSAVIGESDDELMVDEIWLSAQLFRRCHANRLRWLRLAATKLLLNLGAERNIGKSQTLFYATRCYRISKNGDATWVAWIMTKILRDEMRSA